VLISHAHVLLRFSDQPAARPAPAQSAPAPVPAASNAPSTLAPGSGGAPSMAGAIGATIVQGMAFGTGSAIAHRAVDAVAGPRVVQHEMVDGSAAAAGAGAGAASQASNNCADYNASFLKVPVLHCLREACSSSLSWVPACRGCFALF